MFTAVSNVIDVPFFATCFAHLSAMEFVHGQAIAYRDLKCDNVLVTRSYEAKLADFGTCKQLKTKTEKIDSSEREGTLAFMAPEVLTRTPYGVESDVWR